VVILVAGIDPVVYPLKVLAAVVDIVGAVLIGCGKVIAPTKEISLSACPEQYGIVTDVAHNP
jgi:hypothetical protein